MKFLRPPGIWPQFMSEVGIKKIASFDISAIITFTVRIYEDACFDVGWKCHGDTIY